MFVYACDLVRCVAHVHKNNYPESRHALLDVQCWIHIFTSFFFFVFNCIVGWYMYTVCVMCNGK